MASSLEMAMTRPGKQGYNDRGLPCQTVTIDEKETDEWKHGCMDFFRNEAKLQSREKMRDLQKYKMMSNEYVPTDRMWATDPLNLGDKKEAIYGATDPIQHFPVMNSPMNTIWGERINRPITFYCLSESADSVNEYMKEKQEMLFESVSTSIQQTALRKTLMRAQQQGIQITPQAWEQLQQQAQQMSLPQIQQYVDKEYKDVIEQSSNRMMKNLWKKNNLDDEFIEGFRHGTLCGKEFYGIHVMNNWLSIKNLNPFTVFWHKSASTQWVSESQYAGYRMFLTPSSIIDMYRDKLTVEDINKIEDKIYPNRKGGGYNSISGIKSISYDTSIFVDNQGGMFRDYNFDVVEEMVMEYMVTGISSPRPSTSGLIEVIQAYWKSYRKAGILHFYDEMDEERKDWVDENYEPDTDKGEWVNWQYLNQVYQGTLIDEDIYLCVEPYPHQIFDLNDPDWAPLPIEGACYSEFNGKIVSLADLMLPWAEMYDIIAYELKRDIKKAIGKVMFMSADHIPQLDGFSMEKWLYWLREFGIAWVGEGKKKTPFSHYSAQDMSFAEQMVAKMNMLDKIKFNLDSFAGFSQPRLGDTSSEETARGARQSVATSVNQTEYYFWKHTQIIQRTLTNALNISKKILPNNPVYMRNLYDDMEIKYLEVDAKRMRNAMVGLYVVHGSATVTKTESVRQMAIAAAGKQGNPVDMASILLATTENEIKQMLRTLTRKQAEATQQQQQHEQEIAKMEQQEKQADREWEREKHFTELESEERQEWIRSFINQKDNQQDLNADKIPDALQYTQLFEQQYENLRKDQRERRKQDLDHTVKSRELDIKEKDLKVKKEKNQIDLKNQKNDLEIEKVRAKAKTKTST
jgi:hypothetical protein